MEKKTPVTKIVPRSSVDTAIESEKVDGRKKSRLYIPGKEEAIGNIVGAGIEEFRIALSTPCCKKDDFETIQRRTAEYLQRQQERNQLPVMEGLALALGIGRTTLYRWLNDVSEKEVYSFLNMVKDAFSSMHATAAIGGSINPIPWIFYAKNWFNYSDKTEVVVTPNADPLGDMTPAEELQQKYIDSVPHDYDALPDMSKYTKGKE